jgi:hypothetical protein
MYRIDQHTVEMIPSTIYESFSIFNNLEGIIAFPKQYQITSYEDSNYPYEARAGLMLWNSDTGERAKWVNPVYESIRRMKQIEPFPQYMYFCLRRIRYKMKESIHTNEGEPMTHFIEKYPFWKKQLNRIDEEFRFFVQWVYDAYLKLYMYKHKQTNLLEKHAAHARKIHTTVYLPQMARVRKEKTASFYISKRQVTDYFDRMEPRELLYILNL